jgi:hypothetical protein
MDVPPASGLYYLWHPGTRDRFSGYGLINAAWRETGTKWGLKSLKLAAHG